RPAEQPAHLLVERFCELQRAPVENKVLAPPRCEAIFLAVPDGSFRTRLGTLRAEQTPPQVKPEAVAADRDGFRRAGFGTGTAPVRALGRVDKRQTPKAVRQGRHLGRVRDRPVALLEAGERTE